MTKDSIKNLELLTITNEIPGLGRCLRKTGEARKATDDFYYTIKLFVFSYQKYFLVKHPYKYNEYILYSEMKYGGFFKPVGVGRIVEGTNYIKVDFHDLMLTFYLRLGLRDNQYSASAA